LTAFSESYSKYYDLIYSDKDYAKETSFLERLFERGMQRRPRRILDVGAGTGGHAICLAQRGYRVVGVDLSRSMLEEAIRKARSRKLNIDFRVADMRSLKLGRRFDICICMFASIDYLLSYRDLRETFLSIKNHLRKGGLFIFDFWSGTAVLTTHPTDRIKTARSGAIEVIRVAQSVLHPTQNLCDVTYRGFVMNDDKILKSFREKHTVRYYFLEEIRYFLAETGFRSVEFYPFMSLSRKVDAHTWNVACLAKA
jgi:SAM-dependent methyltransferase